VSARSHGGADQKKAPLVGLKAMHRPGTATTHEFFVVMQIKTVEVDALQAFDLVDAKDLARLHFERLAGFRL
jgi:hypothetical protein